MRVLSFHKHTVPTRTIVALLLVLMSALPSYPQDRDTQLVEAARNGHTDTVRVLLKAGRDANTRTPDGATALMAAVSGGHVDTMQALLDAGAVVDARDRDGTTPLILATKQGRDDTVKILLSAGATVDAKDGTTKTALMYAVMLGRISTVQVVLDAGADVNATNRGGESVLMRAAIQGYTDITKYLMSRGADVNVKNKRGRTALMMATKHGYLETVWALLNQGATVNASDNQGETPLLGSAWGSHTETVLVLLEAGANPQSRDRNGETPLMRAARRGSASTVRVLLEAGADVNAKDSQGRTALSLAAQPEVVSLLTRAPEESLQPPPHEEVPESAPVTSVVGPDQETSDRKLRLGSDKKSFCTPTAAYWSNFRGPNRDGFYEEMELRTTWPSDGLPLLWSRPVGGGYASLVIANGQVFSIEQRGQNEVVAAYDLQTGREVWIHSWIAEFRESVGGNGPRATPTWDEGRLYALGATGEFRCLQAATGKLIWARHILKDNDATNVVWGMAASPLIVDEKVIVLPGGPSGKSVVAYHKLTGQPIWKSLDDRQAYTSPMLVRLAGRRQILVVSALRLMGLTVEDGSLLWDYPWETPYDANASQPLVVDENRLLISAGYGHGAALIAIRPANRIFTAEPVWVNKRMKNKISSSVLHEGHVYGLDERILACVDVETGKLKWKGGRYGYGQLLLAGGHLIVLTDSGELVLVKATPEGHQELARFPALKGKTWNNPAIAGGHLLVRNTTEMASFDLRRP